MPKRIFKGTRGPSETKILQIPASRGGYRKMPLGVEVLLTEEEAEFVDGLRDAIIATPARERKPNIKKGVKVWQAES